jgi:aspartyl-tRNA(Asn)/glutamyl-tRNA(Gln) amidotransferase subunit A
MSDQVTRLHAHEMAARLRSGELSSRQLTEAHLDLADRQDHGLHAWLTIDRERALDEADAADARVAAARGEGDAAVDALHPLLGIPVALKDLVSVAGGQCTAGSRILDGYRSPYDAHITERLRDVGDPHDRPRPAAGVRSRAGRRVENPLNLESQIYNLESDLETTSRNWHLKSGSGLRTAR